MIKFTFLIDLVSILITSSFKQQNITTMTKSIKLAPIRKKFPFAWWVQAETTTRTPYELLCNLFFLQKFFLNDLQSANKISFFLSNQENLPIFPYTQLFELLKIIELYFLLFFFVPRFFHPFVGWIYSLTFIYPRLFWKTETTTQRNISLLCINLVQ